MDSQQVIRIFRDWLNRGQAGCNFASHAAAKAHLGYYVVAKADPGLENIHDLTRQVDTFADDRRVAILLFPKIGTIAALARLLAYA